MAKKFKDLNEEDSIWFINPLTQKIDALKIKEITGIPIELTTHIIGAKHYVRIVVFRNDAVLQSPDLDKIPTTEYYFDGRVELQLAMVKVMIGADKVDMPVPYASNKKVLEDFMGNNAATTQRIVN